MRYLLSPEILIIIGVYLTAVTAAAARAALWAWRRWQHRHRNGS
ncbi:hypothetical protein ACIODS_12085 [Micromonospora chalcea]